MVVPRVLLEARKGHQPTPILPLEVINHDSFHAAYASMLGLQG